MIGAMVGPYQILAELGRGGMGEVYRGRDNRLGRDVAIKVLPAAFATDAERLQRFEREARTLAALNHPNIAHVLGLEEVESGRALVMELVEGDDLAARIARGPVPLDEAIGLARQIALALETAHEQGIIHRDLKPANIKVTAEGTVKVLDFGLAKALAPSGASAAGVAGDAAMNSPTLTARATELGLILGTAAYMAPEQARGKVVDRRADIWSFGVVLTEMLTGERAFKGDDVTEVLAKVIERDPDLSKLPQRTPAAIRKLIARCLAKDPKQRLRDIGEARILLDEVIAKAHGSGLDAAAQESPAHARPANTGATSPIRRVLPWALAALATVVAVVFWLQRDSGAGGFAAATAPSEPTRLQIAMPPGIDLYTAVGAAFSLSPDGRTLAFVGVRGGVRQAFIRRFDTFDVTPVRGSDGSVSCIFSPDGRELLVGTSDTSLRRIRLADGFMTVAARGTSDYVGAWLGDGRIVYASNGRLFMTGATPTAEPAQLTQPVEGSTSIESLPVAIPGADAVAFISGRPEAVDSARIEVLTLHDLKRKPIVERGFAPKFTPTGHLLFMRDNEELAVRFDLERLEPVGDPVPVLSGMTIIRNRGVAPLLAVSASGTLVYSSAAAAHTELVSVSRQGAEQVLLRMERAAANPRVSPDQRRVLIEEIGGGLWLFDIERKVESPVTDRALLAGFPILGAGGREVIYRSPGGLFRQPLDGSTRSTLVAGSGPNEFPSSVSADGAHLLFTKLDPTTAGDIYDVPIGGGTPRALVKTAAYEGGAQVSPDGKWIIYVSNELGQNEIFLQAYPAADRRVQVSAGGGIHPAWNPKGGEIFYRRGEDMMSVTVSFASSGSTLTAPEKLFTGRYGFGGGLTIPNYSVSADGKQFFMIKEQSRAILNVVLNWFDELNEKVK
jgi:Tol biopolymer transport system component